MNDAVIRRTSATAAFKIAAKPLQIEMWYLLIAYRKLPSPYLTVSSPTFYDVPFSHNTCVTDRPRTDRQHIIPKVRPNGQPKTASIKLCRFFMKLGTYLTKMMFIFYFC